MTGRLAKYRFSEAQERLAAPPAISHLIERTE
jgi:hypothetical protein